MCEQPAAGEWIVHGFEQEVTGLGSAWMVHKDFPGVSVAAASLPPAVASWLWEHRHLTTGVTFTLRQLYGLDPLPLITPPGSPDP
jgi:hypothetical protein